MRRAPRSRCIHTAALAAGYATSYRSGGIALVAKGIDSRIRVIGIQTTNHRGFFNALHGLLPPDGIGHLNFAISRQLVGDVLLVDDSMATYAMQFLAEREKTVVERTGALGVACLLAHRKQFSGRRVGIVLSG